MILKISFVLLIISLIACQRNQGVQHVDTKAPTIGAESDAGGFDSGGGNGINGKPLESYIFKTILEQPEYTTIIAPALTKLTAILPSLADEVSENFKTKRTWYLIPVALKTLPNEVISAPIEGSTLQMAVHTKTSIWINSLMYNSAESTVESKADLLMHEAVMAVMVTQKIREGQKSLTQEDYENIRALTDIVLKKIDGFTTESLHHFLIHTGFSGYNSGLIPLPLKIKIETKEDLIKFLNQIQDTSKNVSQYFLPRFVYSSKDDICQYKINEDLLAVKAGEQQAEVKFGHMIVIKKNHSVLELRILDQNLENIPIGSETKSFVIIIEGSRIRSLFFDRVQRRARVGSSEPLFGPTESFKGNFWCDFLPSATK